MSAKKTRRLGVADSIFFLPSHRRPRGDGDRHADRSARSGAENFSEARRHLRGDRRRTKLGVKRVIWIRNLEEFLDAILQVRGARTITLFAINPGEMLQDQRTQRPIKGIGKFIGALLKDRGSSTAIAFTFQRRCE